MRVNLCQIQFILLKIKTIKQTKRLHKNIEDYENFLINDMIELATLLKWKDWSDE